jgi:hypothetical protein
MKRNDTALRMRACPRCGGAAYKESLEEDEWRCLQCARSVPPPDKKLLASRA